MLKKILKNKDCQKEQRTDVKKTQGDQKKNKNNKSDSNNAMNKRYQNLVFLS